MLFMIVWIKALHVIAVIAWMAGMLYLPRLFVYHSDAEVGSQISETFNIMERRLLRGILNPSMIVVFATGLPHTGWQLLEHARIAQWDILEFSRNSKHVSPDFPAGFRSQSVRIRDYAAPWRSRRPDMLPVSRPSSIVIWPLTKR